MTRTGTVLLVDDDEDILSSLETLLQLALPDTKVLTVSDPTAALRIVARERPDLIVSDYRMPHMDGIEFLRQTLALAPDATRLMMSAYADADVAARALKDANVALLVTKPFQLDYFVQLVGTALAGRAPAQDRSSPAPLRARR